MIIAIKNEQSPVGLELKKLGYTIVETETNKAVDAILYDSSFNGEFLSTVNDAGMLNSTQESGVLIIDVKGKSPQEIHQIISRRLYTPLF